MDTTVKRSGGISLKKKNLSRNSEWYFKIIFCILVKISLYHFPFPKTPSVFTLHSQIDKSLFLINDMEIGKMQLKSSTSMWIQPYEYFCCLYACGVGLATVYGVPTRGLISSLRTDSRTQWNYVSEKKGRKRKERKKPVSHKTSWPKDAGFQTHSESL